MSIFMFLKQSKLQYNMKLLLLEMGIIMNVYSEAKGIA